MVAEERNPEDVLAHQGFFRVQHYPDNAVVQSGA